MVNRIVLFVILNCIIFSCTNDDIKYIDVHFIQDGVMLPFSINCGMISTGIVQEHLFSKRIKSRTFIKEINKELSSIKDSIININSFHADFQAILYYEGKSRDTLCISNTGNFFLNRRRLYCSPNILELIKKEVKYETSYRNPSKLHEIVSEIVSISLEETKKLDKGVILLENLYYGIDINHSKILVNHLNIPIFDKDSIDLDKWSYIEVKKLRMSQDSAFVKMFRSVDKKEFDIILKKKDNKWYVNKGGTNF